MQTIVWDIDDVLNDLMKNWYELKWLPENNSCKVIYEGLTHNPPYELLEITQEEYLQSLDSFRLSDTGRQLTPAKDVVNWFQLHGHRFRHIALTATPIQCAHNSAAWVLKHFGKWIRSFAYVPSKRHNDPEFNYDITKKDYLQWLGKADILIDDNTGNVEGARQLGIQAFLVPRPWNKADGTFTDILNDLSPDA